jgi:hypothetical protein
MTRPTRRTPAQIAQDNLTKAQEKSAAARKRIARAEAELAAAKAALVTLDEHERYAGQHPDLPVEVRAQAALSAPLSDAQVEAAADD